MALDATVGGEDANTYAVIADVDEYILTHSTPATEAAFWTASTTAQKEAALIRAAQLLDRHVKWTGQIAGEAQALSWPRAFAYDRHDRQIPSSIVPAFLKEFQIETALWILRLLSEVPEIGNGEFDSIRVGSLEIDFNENGGARRMMLPEEVIAALAPVGKYFAQTAGGASSASLVRG